LNIEYSKNQKRMTKVIERTTTSARRRYFLWHDQQITASRNAGTKADAFLIYAYLEGDLGLHIRRTLDRSHYSMLPDTTEQDQDQVLLQHLDEGGPKAVVIVDQLWIVDGECEIPLPS
jgi:hypothetical protein